MALVVDDTIEQGRLDVICAGESSPGTVDVNLVLHVYSTDDAAFARKLVADTAALYTDGAHVRAKVYIAEFNSVLVYVSDSGLERWAKQMAGERPEQRVAQQHYATGHLALYRECMRQYTSEPFCTHEVCYTDGSAVYYAGV